MANFKLKDGLVVGSNGIIFSDSTVQTTAANFTPTVSSPANNDILVYANGIWINSVGPFEISLDAFSTKTFNSYVSLSGGGIDNLADLTIDEVVENTLLGGTANTANLTFNSNVSSKQFNDNFFTDSGVIAGTYGTTSPLPEIAQITVDSKGRITSATNITIFSSTGVSAGTYGSASQVPQFVVDSYGRITSASNVNVAGVSAFNYHTGNANFQIATADGGSYTASIGQHLGTTANVTFNYITASNDITASSITASNNITASSITASGVNLTNLNASNISSGTLSTSRLATSGVSSGTYGGATSIPQIVVDSYGRITSASNVSASSINSFNYHTGNANFEIVTSTGSLTAGIGQDLGTTSNPTFNNLVISGNLTVQGTTTTISANNLKVEDNLIYLNDSSSNTNVDLGFAGNYNDGTYRHAGLFRDATDGIFKFFDRYTPEPDAAANINVSHASFGFASLKAENIIANSQVIANSYITIDSYSGFSEGGQIIMAWAGATPSTDSSKRSWNIDVDGSNNLRIYKVDAAGSANVPLTISNTAGTITAESNWKFGGNGSGLTNLDGSQVSSGTVANARTTASSSNGASTIVARDASGDFTARTITATTFVGSGASLTGILTGTASSSNGASTIVQRDGSGSFTANSITCTTLTETSSITYKENFEILSNPIESLLKLQAYVYDRKDGSRKNEPGLILEDVKDVIPNIVSEDGISYTRLTVYLLEGIKQLKQEIEDLKRKYGDT